MTIENKKAFFDYEILEQYECGMKLEGWEVKALASGTCSIAGSHCKVFGPDVMLIGASIGGAENDIQRSRKLLLHKKEISRLVGKTHEKGLTLIPLRIYATRGKFKLSIGVARGKKEYDKREAAKKTAIENDNRRIIKSQKFE